MSFCVGVVGLPERVWTALTWSTALTAPGGIVELGIMSSSSLRVGQIVRPRRSCGVRKFKNCCYFELYSESQHKTN